MNLTCILNWSLATWGGLNFAFSFYYGKYFCWVFGAAKLEQQTSGKSVHLHNILIPRVVCCTTLMLTPPSSVMLMSCTSVSLFGFHQTTSCNERFWNHLVSSNFKSCIAFWTYHFNLILKLYVLLFLLKEKSHDLYVHCSDFNTLGRRHTLWRQIQRHKMVYKHWKQFAQFNRRLYANYCNWKN